MNVFGPVLSRRLGLSLGVDPVASKTCNWNCVYCQLGMTFPMTGTRRRFCDPGQVIGEIVEQIGVPREKKIDWITFVGSGETLLSIDMGILIDAVKSMTDIPVAVITNGSMLGEREIMEELRSADAVLPSLDAGTEDLYIRINRPMPAFSFQRHMEGLRRFRETFSGKLWIEVMLLKGINDSEEAIESISDRIEEINPDQVHLLTPTRPPAESWVYPAGYETLLLASSIIGRKFSILVPEEPIQNLKILSGSFSQSVKDIVKRHPLREEAVLLILGGVPPEEARSAMEELLSDGSISVIGRMGIRFLVDRPSRYSF